jgi:hypothetical protein
MRTYFLLFPLLLCSFLSKSQEISVSIDFEDTNLIKRYIKLDTNNNIWRIGHPQKSKIKNSENAIITGLTQGYPVKGNSSFVLKFLPLSSIRYDITELWGYFSVDSDSLHDYGVIEMSYDGGKNWINIMDTGRNYGIWYTDGNLERPIFTGNQTDKLHTFIFIFEKGYALTVDTLRFRFTFISDSIPENKDGWAFDDFWLINRDPGWIDENKYTEYPIKISPNPVRQSEDVFISIKNRTANKINLINSQGKIIAEFNNPNNSLNINTNNFQKGIFFIEVIDNTGRKEVEKLVIY